MSGSTLLVVIGEDVTADEVRDVLADDLECDVEIAAADSGVATLNEDARDGNADAPDRDVDRTFVVEPDDSPVVWTDEVETVLTRNPWALVVVYAAALSESTVRTLLTSERVEYVPSEVPAGEALLSIRARRFHALERHHRLRHAAGTRLPSVLDDVSEGFLAVNPDGHVVYCNRAAEELLEITREDILGRRIEQVAPIADSKLLHLLVESMDADRPMDLETTIGSGRYDVRTYPSAGGLSVFARDVTERHDRDRLFTAAFQGAMDAVVIADDAGRYVDVNDAAVDLFGAGSIDALIGRSVVEFTPEEYDVAAEWERFLASDRDRGLFPLVRADGERRVVEFAATPDVIEGRHLSVLRDVTDHEGFPSFETLVSDAHDRPRTSK